MEEFDVLVIGGGPALREFMRTSRLMSREARLGAIRLDKVMINHCAMPYALAKRTTIDEVIAPDTLVTRGDAKLFIDEARQVDPKEKVVKCANDSLKYKRLILAMGADPIRPPIPGINLKNILTIRHFEDLKKLEELLDLPQTRNVVIVGGGYIGTMVWTSSKIPSDVRKARGISRILDRFDECEVDRVVAFEEKYF